METTFESYNQRKKYSISKSSIREGGHYLITFRTAQDEFIIDRCTIDMLDTRHVVIKKHKSVYGTSLLYLGDYGIFWYLTKVK